MEGRREREMGNFWIPEFDSSSSSSPSSTRPSSPGIAQNTSNEGTHSGTGSAFSSRLDEVSPDGLIFPTSNLRVFTFAELKTATWKFSPDTLLGEGTFGTVFKGWIDEKTFAPTKAGSRMAIAVKKMKPECWQGHVQWLSEVNILGSLSHPNIVRLLGFCKEGKELLLAYEFMPSGSLANHLFSRGSAFQSLSWSIWLKIAIGVARGLAFLHCSERKIIYRSLKPCDILLDLVNSSILISWLARNGPQGEDSYVETCVKGTSGYAAPEYVATGAVQAAQLILKCLGSDPRRRPSMSEVVETLEQIQAIKHKPQEPKNNPRRPTDHNHSHNRSPLHPQAGNVGNGKNAHQ